MIEQHNAKILALIMRYHEVCKLLYKTEHSSDLSALGIGLPFQCLVKLPACSQSQSLYSNITRIIGSSDLWEGEPGA